MTDAYHPDLAAIHDAGYCVFALNYGDVFGIAPMEDSAGQLATFVDGVLAATGAAKVDIVGHSEGGLMPRWYLRFLGGVHYGGNDHPDRAKCQYADDDEQKQGNDIGWNRCVIDQFPKNEK